jgi:formate dehydrogenase iron-sulfur subunit
MIRLYVPSDSAAVAVGADEIAEAILVEAARRSLPIDLVRNGSRGAFGLEPLVEVATAHGRVGYGRVEVEDVPGLFDAGLADGGDHPKRIGRPDDLPFIQRQTRLTFARCGLTDPLSLEDYRAGGGFEGLDRARALPPAEVVARVAASGLRGRGGAGFPAGVKWETVRHAAGQPKYVVCNADEGDSGTFADRMLLEGDPFLLIEGMAIAALAVGATKGFVYIRSEYPLAVTTFGRALDIARTMGLIGGDFDIEVRVGSGAYICGEETALLESLEGRRGQVRAKPPLPAESGLFGRPTLVNNVLTLAAVPYILANGPDAYAAHGHGRSRGTAVIQLGGDIRNGGLFEAPFGMTLGELVDEIGGGTLSGRPVRAVQVGGPLGAFFPRELFDTPFDYEAFAARDGLVGHGGIVVFSEGVDMARQALAVLEFCAAESCGKCTPCRIGTVRGSEIVREIITGEPPQERLALLEDLCETLALSSLCALGGLTPLPVRSAVRHFPEDFGSPRSAAALRGD